MCIVCSGSEDKSEVTDLFKPEKSVFILATDKLTLTPSAYNNTAPNLAMIRLNNLAF